MSIRVTELTIWSLKWLLCPVMHWSLEVWCTLVSIFVIYWSQKSQIIMMTHGCTWGGLSICMCHIKLKRVWMEKRILWIIKLHLQMWTVGRKKVKKNKIKLKNFLQVFAWTPALRMCVDHLWKKTENTRSWPNFTIYCTHFFYWIIFSGFVICGSDHFLFCFPQFSFSLEKTIKKIKK